MLPETSRREAHLVSRVLLPGWTQIKGPTTFTGFGAGVLTTNTSGVLSSEPLTAAQIPLLPYLLLTGGTLTGTLNGQAANFTGAVTGLTSLPSDNSNNLATTAFVQSAISSVASSSGAWKLTGNSGTVDGTNFIGTTDNAPLNFKINNTAREELIFFQTTLYLVLVRGAPMALTIPSLGIVHLLKILEATLTQPLGPLLFIPIKMA